MSFFSSLGKIAGAVAAPFTGGASLLPSLISGGASLVGGIMQNNSAKDLAASNNQMSIELANTAHQRETKDLLAAGLNPILSANGGASTPNLNTAPIGNVVGSAVGSALQARLLNAQLENIQMDTMKKEAEATLTNTQQTKTNNENTLFYDTMEDVKKRIAADASTSSAQSLISGIDADSAKTMGELTRDLERGGSAAKSIATALQLMKGLSK